MNSLIIDSVQKSYWLNKVLTDVYVHLGAGEIVGLVGRNGSGKSTLLKIMFGAIHADFKFIRINGKVYSNPYLTKGLVTYLPQNNFIPGYLKVSNAIKQFLRDTNSSIAVLSDEIISKVSQQKVRQLSGGELRYLEIQLILHKKSDFTLLDEPFNGVAPLHIEMIKQDIISRRSDQEGIIVTDHDYRNVLDLCDRIILLFDGGSRHIKDPSELVKFGYLPKKI